MSKSKLQTPKNNKDTEEIAIKVDGVFKSFKIPHEKNSSLKSTLFHLFKRKSYTSHKAAEDISFEVKKGEFLGIIGRNGSGKSTMLKMLAGIYLPDKGKVAVEGRLSPFLELGVGFNPELSARDNIYLNGTILGLTREEINDKFDEIIQFGELEEFVDQKLKNFSSGMQVRLAFSIAIQAHADVILIDEVLAVGDTNFQQKCLQVFRNLKKEGKTVIFVSHSMEMVEKFCDRVILIDKAKICFTGEPEKAAIKYQLLNVAEAKHQKIKVNKIDITSVTILDEGGKETKRIFPKAAFKVKFNFRIEKLPKEKINVGLRICEAETQLPLVTLNSMDDQFEVDAKEGDNELIISFDENPINYGNFYLLGSLFVNKNEIIEYLASYNGMFNHNYFLIGGDKKAAGLLSLRKGWRGQNENTKNRKKN